MAEDTKADETPVKKKAPVKKKVAVKKTPQGFRFKNDYTQPISVGGFRLRPGEVTRSLSKGQVDAMRGNPTTKVQVAQKWVKIIKA